LAVEDRQREAKRLWAERNRRAGQGITIPFPEDPGRRIACLGDSELFLTTYFPHVFWQGFTPDRREMAEAIRLAAVHGGDQSVAGPRGEGKTRLGIFESFRLVLKRQLWFPLLITKNAGSASEALDALKYELETNVLLAADFPEVCVPIRELDGWASKARKQHVNGHKPDVLWTKDLIALPNLPDEVLRGLNPAWREMDSCALGQLFACVGIEGRIRGRNVRNRRPDLAIIDDVDDRESAGSEKQTDDREKIIDSDIAGLAGPGERVARVMLCTLLNRRCVAYKFTDPKEKPSWKGKRLRAMLKEPERKDLWEEYVDRRQSGMEGGNDPLGRDATRFYLENREEMDRGAEMSNPANFTSAAAEDGEPLEHSAVQAFYNKVADFGWPSVLTEYQQEPPLDGEPEQDGLSKNLIRSRLSGLGRREVPFGAKLVAHIDLGKWRIHYTACAWQPGAIGSVVDYGEKRTAQPEVHGVERAIRLALDELAEQWESEPYTDPDGEVIPFDVVLIDAGNWNTVVYDFCRERGKPFMAAMGDSRFHMPNKPTVDRKPGYETWYLSRQRHKGMSFWVVNMDADKAKRWLHARLLTPPWVEDDEGNSVLGADGQPQRRRGSLALFGEDPREHGEFADHILAERFEREFKEGKKGLEERWVKVRPDNHYLDNLYGCCVGASIAGIRLLGDGQRPKRKREKLSALVAKRRERT
jgi:hypothetical protein